MNTNLNLIKEYGDFSFTGELSEIDIQNKIFKNGICIVGISKQIGDQSVNGTIEISKEFYAKLLVSKIVNMGCAILELKDKLTIYFPKQRLSKGMDKNKMFRKLYFNNNGVEIAIKLTEIKKKIQKEPKKKFKLEFQTPRIKVYAGGGCSPR